MVGITATRLRKRQKSTLLLTNCTRAKATAMSKTERPSSAWGSNDENQRSAFGKYMVRHNVDHTAGSAVATCVRAGISNPKPPIMN